MRFLKNNRLLCYILIILILFQFNIVSCNYRETDYGIDKKATYDIKANVVIKTYKTKVKSRLRQVVTSQEKMQVENTTYIKFNAQDTESINLDVSNIFEILLNKQISNLNFSGIFIVLTQKSDKNILLSFLSDNHKTRSLAVKFLFKDITWAPKSKWYIIKRFLGMSDEGWYYGSNDTKFSVNQRQDQKELHVTLDGKNDDVVVQKLFNKLDLSKNNFMEFTYSLDDITVQNVSIKCGVDFNNDNKIDSYIAINQPGKNISDNVYTIKTNLYELTKNSFPDKKTYNLREVIIHFHKREGVTLDTPREVTYGLNSFSVYSEVPDVNFVSKFIDNFASYKPEDTISLPLEDYIVKSRNQYGFKVNLSEVLSQNNIDIDETTISNVVVVVEGDKSLLDKTDLIKFAGFYSEDEVEYPAILKPYVAPDPDGTLDEFGRIKNLSARKPNYKLYFGLSKENISQPALRYRWQVETDNTRTIIIPDNEGVVYTKKMALDNPDDKVVIVKKLETPVDVTKGKTSFVIDINPQDPNIIDYSLVLGDETGKEMVTPLTYHFYSERDGFRRYSIDLDDSNLKKVNYVKLIYSPKVLKNKNTDEGNETNGDEERPQVNFAVVIRTAKIVAQKGSEDDTQVLTDLMDKNTFDLINQEFEGWRLKANNSFNLALDPAGTKFGPIKNVGMKNYLVLSKNLSANIDAMPYFQMNGTVHDKVQKVKVEFDLLVDGKPKTYLIDYNFGEEVNLKNELAGIWPDKRLVIREIKVMLYCMEEERKSAGYSQRRYVFTLKDLNFYNKLNMDLIGFLKNERIIEPNTLNEKNMYDVILDAPLVRLDGKVYTLRNFAIREGYSKVNEIVTKTMNGEESWVTLDKLVLDKGNHDIKLLPGSFIEAKILELKEYTPDKKSKKEPTITFHKINPTRYIVNVTAEDSFWLVFSESFHEGWKAYILKNTSHDYSKDRFQWSALATAWQQRNDRIEVKDHQMVNGYANGWWVDISPVQKVKGLPVKFQMVLEYKPQQYFEIGVIISFTTLLFSIGYLIFDFIRRRRKK